MLTLSNQIFKEKRIVYDTFMMVGDVGGLNDFVTVILAYIVSNFSEYFMKTKLISKLYREPPKPQKRPSHNLLVPRNPSKLTRPIKFTKSFICFHAFLPRKCLERKQECKAFFQGIDTIEKQIDLAKMVR